MANPSEELGSWANLKKEIYFKKRGPYFREMEIWWTSIGFNIGWEENGKNKFFERPILVVRKFNNNIFLGVPLTTKVREGKYYFRIVGQKVDGDVILSQIRLMDAKRLIRRIETIDKEMFTSIKRLIKKLI